MSCTFFVAFLLWADDRSERRRGIGYGLAALNFGVVILGCAGMLRDRFGSLGFRKMVERLRRKRDALFARRDAPALELVDVKARRISAPGRPVDGSADAIARRQMTERRRQHLKRHKARRPDGGYGNFPEAAGVAATSNPLRRGGAAPGYGGGAPPGYGAYPAPPATVGGVNPMRRSSAAPAGVAYANYAAPDATVAGVNPMRRGQEPAPGGILPWASVRHSASQNADSADV